MASQILSALTFGKLVSLDGPGFLIASLLRPWTRMFLLVRGHPVQRVLSSIPGLLLPAVGNLTS